VAQGPMKAVIERIPVKRLGRLEEVARAVCVLTDEDSGCVTARSWATMVVSTCNSGATRQHLRPRRLSPRVRVISAKSNR
jgi:hypothetical protein